MRGIRIASWLGIGFLAFLFCPGASFGVDQRFQTAPPPGTPARPPLAPGAFGGVLYTVSSLSSLSFSPMDGADQWADSFSNFKFFINPPAFWGGGIALPSGAVIDFIGLGSCDGEGGNMAVYVVNQFIDGTSDAIASFSSTAHPTVPFCAMDYNPVAVGYQVVGNSGSSIQIIVEQLAHIDGSVRFASVEVWWHTVVSPPPASPSFLDVLPSNPFYQYVEALKASGITGGCGDGSTFCPDQPVLRKQMAAFLAKALGLAWPY